METERNPNEPIKPAAPGQQRGQEGDRDKEKEREKQGGGQEGGHKNAKQIFHACTGALRCFHRLPRIDVTCRPMQR